MFKIKVSIFNYNCILCHMYICLHDESFWDVLQNHLILHVKQKLQCTELIFFQELFSTDSQASRWQAFWNTEQCSHIQADRCPDDERIKHHLNQLLQDYTAQCPRMLSSYLVPWEPDISLPNTKFHEHLLRRFEDVKHVWRNRYTHSIILSC